MSNRIFSPYSWWNFSCLYCSRELYDASLNGALVGGLAALVAIIIAFVGEFAIKNPGQTGIDITSFLILGAVDAVLGIILGVFGGLIGYYLEKRIVKDEISNNN